MSEDTRDPLALFLAVEASVLDGPGTLPPAERRAAAEGLLGGPLSGLAQKTREAAWKVSDDEVAALTASGVGDDAIFEAVVASALGAARLRLDAALRSLEEEPT